MSVKEKILNEVRDSYKRLLPDVHPKDLEQALEDCFKDGMTAKELSKVTYAYLYPVKEPSLWSEK